MIHPAFKFTYKLSEAKIIFKLMHQGGIGNMGSMVGSVPGIATLKR